MLNCFLTRSEEFPCLKEEEKRKDWEDEEEELRSNGGLFDSLLFSFQSSWLGSNMSLRSKRSRRRGRGQECSYSQLPQGEEKPIWKKEKEKEADMVTQDKVSSSPLSSSSPSTTTFMTPMVSLREEDYDWGDEELTCSVCDRSFSTPWDLQDHRVKRRHWDCGVCDTLFWSEMDLEHHKEQWDHWSDEEESSDSQGEELEDLNVNLVELVVYEEETIFGEEIEERILLCSQD